MSAILDAASLVFNWFFVTSTGTNAHTAAIVSIIQLVTQNDYLLLGLGMMLSGLAVKYLSSLIRHT